MVFLDDCSRQRGEPHATSLMVIAIVEGCAFGVVGGELNASLKFPRVFSFELLGIFVTTPRDGAV